MNAAIPARGPRRRFALALLAAAIATWAQSAEACSVCLSATEGTREAYYLTTVLMMAIPFVLLGTLLYWLRKAAGRRDATRKPPS
jgi:heme/copper-type cytochrome/quinol oxidase subunit 2